MKSLTYSIYRGIFCWEARLGLSVGKPGSWDYKIRDTRNENLRKPLFMK